MSSRLVSLRAAATLLLLGVAACTDRNPVDGGTPRPSAPHTERFDCVVQVRSQSMSCRQAGAPSGVRSSIIVGGQNTFVKLTTESVVYESEIHTLTASVTLQNLLPQPIGTDDGVTPVPQGSLVFFHNGPVVTEGTGDVLVANPDTTGTFTASEQPAFRYDGILQPYQVSAPKDWRFSVSGGVVTFAFTLFVEVTLPNETGWVDVAPPHPYLLLGDTMHLVATVRTATGAAAADQHVAWFSSDTNVVKVDSTGRITGVGVGTTSVNALNGNRFGSQQVTVVASRGGDVVPPTIYALDIAPRAVSTGAGGTVGLTISIRDAGTGVQPLSIGGVFQSASGNGQANLSGCSLASGNNANGTWSCSATIPQFAEVGPWNLVELTVEDVAGNPLTLDSLALRSAGFPRSIYVTGVQDTDWPTLTQFGFSPEAVDVRGQAATVAFDLAALDSVSGVGSATVLITSPSGQQQLGGEPCARQTGDATYGTYSCLITVPRYVEDGTWQVGVELADRSGNSHLYDAAELKRLGFPNTLAVTSTADSLAPSIAGFSFSPDSVDVTDSTGATVDSTGAPVDSTGASISVTVRALDSVSGVAEVRVIFTSPSEFAAAGGCTMEAGTGVDGTWVCAVILDTSAEAGVWQASVEITDNAGNLRTYTADELQSLGFPTALTVTRNFDNR